MKLGKIFCKFANFQDISSGYKTMIHLNLSKIPVLYCIFLKAADCLDFFENVCMAVPSMALYFFSISTILGGPGGPLANKGTDGLSSLFSHSDIESLLSLSAVDFCKFVSNVLKNSDVK